MAGAVDTDSYAFFRYRQPTGSQERWRSILSPDPLGLDDRERIKSMSKPEEFNAEEWLRENREVAEKAFEHWKDENWMIVEGMR